MHPAPTAAPAPPRHRLRATGLRVAVALAAVVIVGLGPALPTAAVMDDAAAPQASTSIMIMDYRYQPASPTLTVGDSVTWTNHDQAEHDVAGTSGPEALQSPMLAQGQSWTHTFGQAGTYSYLCSVHPEMVASLTVNPAPTTTAPPAPAPVVEVPVEAPVETGAPVPEASGAPVAAPAPGAAVPTPAPANAPTTVAGAGNAAESPSSDELTAAPTGATEPTTDLPPLAVAGVVVAIVLATTLALFGPGTARGAAAADTAGGGSAVADDDPEDTAVLEATAAPGPNGAAPATATEITDDALTEETPVTASDALAELADPEAANPDADPTAGPDDPTATTDP